MLQAQRPTLPCLTSSVCTALSRCRADILRQYARHLQGAEVLAVTHATPGLAGRDLKSICEQAERRWASKASAGHTRGQSAGRWHGRCLLVVGRAQAPARP